MDRTRLVSLGWFDHGNCGDEAFKHALATLFPEADITYVNNIPRNLDVINNSDHLVIGGGNIVDSGFLRNLDEVRVPYSFIGVGVVRDTDLSLMLGAQSIIVRDQDSLDLVSRAFPNAILAPDITFIFEPNAEKGRAKLLSLPGINPDKKTVGVLLNDCVSAGFDSTILKFIECEKVKFELSRFLQHGIDYNVLFIPMSVVPPDDRRISLDVRGKMRHGYKYHCITEELDPLDCLDLMSSLDFCINMRLHADIFCTIGGVPFIDLVHHDKNKSYLQTLGESILATDFYELSLRVLQDKFKYLEDNSDDISTRLSAKASKNKIQLQEAIESGVHLRPEREN